jgi:hypothetical protein
VQIIAFAPCAWRSSAPHLVKAGGESPPAGGFWSDPGSPRYGRGRGAVEGQWRPPTALTTSGNTRRRDGARAAHQDPAIVQAAARALELFPSEWRGPLKTPGTGDPGRAG